MEEKYTLLVWNLCPEAVELYLIPNDVANKYSHFLVQAQNKLINCNDENEGMTFLNTALSNEVPEYGDPNEDSVGLFIQYKVSLENPIADKIITAVYVSGFLL